MEAITKAGTCTKARGVARIALLIVLGAMLAGCDKCGNFSPLGSQAEIEVCREQPPKSQ
jgi:hypothetical protein